MGFELFGDVDAPETATIIVGKESDEEKFVNKVWKAWTKSTDRPSRPVPDNVARQARKFYEERLSLNDAMRVVSAASYLAPHKKDPSDTGRLVSAMKSKNVRNSALSLMDSGEHSPIMYSTEQAALKTTSSQIAKVCGVPVSLWTQKDHESAGYIAEKCDDDTLKRVAGEVKKHIGEDAVFPSELVRHSKLWTDKSAKLSASGRSGRSTYSSGETESNVLSSVDTDADPRAGHLLLTGKYQAEDIAKFHNDVPNGYWRAVQKVMDNDLTVTARQAYDMVASSFGGFDPNSRQEP